MPFAETPQTQSRGVTYSNIRWSFIINWSTTGQNRRLISDMSTKMTGILFV